MPTRQGNAGVHQTGPRAWEERARGFVLVWPDVAGGDNRKVKAFRKVRSLTESVTPVVVGDVGDLRRFMDLNLEPQLFRLFYD
jgi:hypothetical protein